MNYFTATYISYHHSRCYCYSCHHHHHNCCRQHHHYHQNYDYEQPSLQFVLHTCTRTTFDNGGAAYNSPPAAVSACLPTASLNLDTLRVVQYVMCAALPFIAVVVRHESKYVISCDPQKDGFQI